VEIHEMAITIGWGKSVPLPSAPCWPPPGGLAAAREGGAAVPPPVADSAGRRIGKFGGGRTGARKEEVSCSGQFCIGQCMLALHVGGCRSWEAWLHVRACCLPSVVQRWRVEGPSTSPCLLHILTLLPPPGCLLGRCGAWAPTSTCRSPPTRGSALSSTPWPFTSCATAASLSRWAGGSRAWWAGHCRLDKHWLQTVGMAQHEMLLKAVDEQALHRMPRLPSPLPSTFL